MNSRMARVVLGRFYRDVERPTLRAGTRLLGYCRSTIGGTDLRRCCLPDLAIANAFVGDDRLKSLT